MRGESVVEGGGVQVGDGGGGVQGRWRSSGRSETTVE